MAKRKTKRELADEAYLRSIGELPPTADDAATALLGMSIGLPEGTLPGQENWVDGSVAGAPEESAPVAGIPEICPECHRPQTLKAGWTPLDKSVRAPAIQCGGCGVIVTVTEAAHEQLRATLRAAFAQQTKAAPKPGRQSRGAR